MEMETRYSVRNGNINPLDRKKMSRKKTTREEKEKKIYNKDKIPLDKNRAAAEPQKKKITESKASI